METLKQIGCPKPCEKIQEEPENEGEPEKKKDSAQQQQKKPGKKPGKTEKEKETAPAKGVQVYKPGDFNEIFKSYIKAQKAAGYSHKESLAMWQESSERKRLLEDMPLSEKKKRRFV